MTGPKIIICFVLILSLPSLGISGQKEFIESYTYTAGEADSKLTCRTVSLIEVKRLLLERKGRQDIEKAAALGSNRAIRWLEEDPGRKKKKS